MGDKKRKSGKAAYGVVCQDDMTAFKKFVKACLECQRAYSELALASLDEADAPEVFAAFRKDAEAIDLAERNLESIRCVATIGYMLNMIPNPYFDMFAAFVNEVKSAFSSDEVMKADAKIAEMPAPDGGNKA